MSTATRSRNKRQHSKPATQEPIDVPLEPQPQPQQQRETPSELSLPSAAVSVTSPDENRSQQSAGEQQTVGSSDSSKPATLSISLLHLDLTKKRRTSKMHTKRQQGSIDNAIEAGYVITHYAQHENNENFTVHVCEPDKIDTSDSTVFTNVSSSHLTGLLTRCGIEGPLMTEWNLPRSEQQRRQLQQIQQPDNPLVNKPSEESTETSKGPSHMSFDECMRQGGRVVELFEPSRPVLYTVKVQMRDGSQHVFPTVSHAHLMAIGGDLPQATAAPAHE